MAIDSKVVYLDYEQRSPADSNNPKRVFVTIELEGFLFHSSEDNDWDNRYSHLIKRRSDLSPKDIMHQYQEKLKNKHNIEPDIFDLHLEDLQTPNSPFRIGFNNPSNRKRRKLYGCFKSLADNLQE
jgi:hypothetical protein